MEKGFIHLYTGNGKGKTTAALGVCLRAVCAGKKVYFGQFIKGMKYSEVDAINYLPNITFEDLGIECALSSSSNGNISVTFKGLERLEEVFKSGEYDIVVLDELTIALYYNLFTIKEILTLLRNKPKNLDVIITGRHAPKELIDVCHLVTDMHQVKHYYQTSAVSKKGIDC